MWFSALWLETNHISTWHKNEASFQVNGVEIYILVTCTFAEFRCGKRDDEHGVAVMKDVCIVGHVTSTIYLQSITCSSS